MHRLVDKASEQFLLKDLCKFFFYAVKDQDAQCKAGSNIRYVMLPFIYLYIRLMINDTFVSDVMTSFSHPSSVWIFDKICAYAT